MQPDIRRPVAVLIALIALLIFLTMVGALASLAPSQPALPAVQPTEMPTITPEEEAQLAQNPTFQELISYTDRGFEPSTLTAKAGDTVRFTNNSSHPLWVAASGLHLYPGVQNGCGSSALDSCGPLQPGHFWQFTFTASGTWSYQNNLNSIDTGVVHVK